MNNSCKTWEAVEEVKTESSIKQQLSRLDKELCVNRELIYNLADMLKPVLNNIPECGAKTAEKEEFYPCELAETLARFVCYVRSTNESLHNSISRLEL